MSIVHERIRASIPTRELERRWAEVRKAMRSTGIDCLVMNEDNRYRCGMIRYFTDIPPGSNPMSVIFPLNDEMTTITSGGPLPSPPSPPAWAVRGVANRISIPFFPNVESVNKLDAEAAATVLKTRGDKRIGIVRPRSMSALFYNCLQANLPGVEFVDFTDPLTISKLSKARTNWSLPGCPAKPRMPSSRQWLPLSGQASTNMKYGPRFAGFSATWAAKSSLSC